MTGNPYESPLCDCLALLREGPLCTSVRQNVNTGAFDAIDETSHDDWLED